MPATKRMLIVDDDTIFCQAIVDGFSRGNLQVEAVHRAEDAMTYLKNHRVDLLLLDQNLPDGTGTELCPKILEASEQCKIIFITAYPSIEDAVEAIRSGAHDYLSKPFELEALRMSIRRCLKSQELERIRELHDFKTRKEKAENIVVGTEEGLFSTMKLARMAAESSAPVLITGETGTGKNLLAQTIHYESPLRDKPMVSINCAALAENLIESELFGYEKGAFTGAESAKKGIFEVADGGTLFLDEIGAIPPRIQSKMLGVLEDGSMRRVGGTTTRRVNVRPIAATNLNMETAIAAGEFRSDLFYRLGVFRIHLPPLRERPEDIPALCRYFIAKFALGKPCQLPQPEIDHLCRYDWPGNVRELRNVIERAIIVSRDGNLRPSKLFQREDSPILQTTPESRPSQALTPETLEPLEDIELRYIQQALDVMDGNITQTARKLGIAISTLKRKMRRR